MENKKLLNFLLNDLYEIDELFSEENKVEFDKPELEFIQTRLKGAIKLVNIFIERVDSNSLSQKNTEPVIIHETVKEKIIEPEMLLETETGVEGLEEKIESETFQDLKIEDTPVKKEVLEERVIETGDIEFEEEITENSNKRLGDVFMKEKSVNELVAGQNKLDNILSNRPVKSIKTAIGINDRFQYIRELFEGKADEFVQTVDELDRMNNLKEAVQFLQVNFKWKKNETSLKFVNLIKRRFLNE